MQHVLCYHKIYDFKHPWDDIIGAFFSFEKGGFFRKFITFAWRNERRKEKNFEIHENKISFFTFVYQVHCTCRVCVHKKSGFIRIFST